MKTRLDFTRVSMQSLKPLFALGAQAEISGLEHSLLELVSWNRLNVAFRIEAGGYRPGMFEHLLKTA